jgi:hypothetical protein
VNVQPLAILFGAAFTVATAGALGGLLLGNACRELAVRFVCGSAILSLLVFCLCCAGLAYPAVFLALGIVSIAAGWIARRRQTAQSGVVKHSGPSDPVKPPLQWGRRFRLPSRLIQKTPRRSESSRGFTEFAKYLLLAVFASYCLTYWMNAMAPEISPDGSTYHLGLVARYLREHGFHPITWNLYASLSEAAEMLFLFAFAFGQHSAAAMVHFAFLLALTWMVFAYGKRAGFPLAGSCAALLVFVSPIVGFDGTSAYNDVALAAAAFTLFYVLQLWSDARAPRLLAAAGVLAGFSYGVKYTGWVAVVYAVGFVLWKSRGIRDAALVAACALPLLAPWPIKNWLWVGNPLAPFFNQYFRNPNVTIAFEKDYVDYFRHYELTSLWQIPKALMVSASLQGLLGPVFLLAPLALIALRWRAGRHLLVAALVFGANYFSNIGTRFLIPPLPFVALAMSMALASVPALAVAVVVLHAVLSWPSVIPRYALPGTMHLNTIPWREALRLRDTFYFMRPRLAGYTAARMIEERTPPGTTVFSFRPVPEAYISRHVLIEYQSAGNELLGRILRGAFNPGFAPTWRARFDFPRQSCRAIRVVQTAAGNDLWSIHELRILDGDREVPRDPRWRLTADPFPWTIQQAFDNSLVTLWRSGEAIHPGMYVAVEFGAAQPMTAVLLESSPDQGQIRLKLEGQDAAGQWRPLAAAPAISSAAPPLGLRRAAARELERHGIRYILLFDGEYGADDFRENQDLWGIRQVGEVDGARLYRLP